MDGEAGVLEYRGIRIEEVAKQSYFLETSYFLLGEFQSHAESDQFTADVIRHRHIKYRNVDLIKCLP